MKRLMRSSEPDCTGSRWRRDWPDAPHAVVILERRAVIGGNAADRIDPETGILVHAYGSHIFHTSNERVFDYVRQFTELNTFRFRAFAQHAGQIYSLPINPQAITAFYGRTMTPDEARAVIAREAGAAPGADNLEDWAVSRIGRPLYEAFIRGYTAKQWQTDPRDLPSDIIARLPVRYTLNGDYFDDRYQVIPPGGYSAWFQRMIASPLIEVRLGVDFFEANTGWTRRSKWPARHAAACAAVSTAAGSPSGFVL